MEQSPKPFPAKFHDLHRSSSAQAIDLRREAAADPADWPLEWSRTYTKDYPRLPLVELPASQLPSATMLDGVLNHRQSRRSRSTDACDIHRLSTLLEFGLGLRSGVEGEAHASRRRYPSAGARFTTEAYVWLSDCAGLDSGLCHYNVERHALRVLRTGEALETAKRRIFAFDWVCEASVLIVLTAVMWRSYEKYAERSYRYALLEAGHVMQNFCLIATALDISLTPLGGFADIALWELLDVGDVEELPLYVAVIP